MGRGENAIRYLFWSLILVILVLSYFVLKEFLIAIASAFILAYILRPLNERLKKKLDPKSAALVSILIILLILGVILVFVIGSLITQLAEFTDEQTIAEIVDGIKNLPFQGVLTDNLSLIVSRIGEVFLGLVSEVIEEMPKKILAIFVTLFTTYYILLEWNKLREKISRILPFNNKQQILNKVENVIGDIIIGTFVLALLEGVIMTFAFLVLGIEFAVLFGFLVAIFAFVPALGPMLIWVPVALVELAKGDLPTAVGVSAVGLFLSSYVDGILRIRLIGKKADIHPVVMLVGLLGGIQIFGLIGFILGPIILSILLIIIENIPKME